MALITLKQKYRDRHPSVTSVLKYLDVNPNLQGDQKHIALCFHELADSLTDMLPDSPELTTGLRKMLEAKDCLVRASLPI